MTTQIDLEPITIGISEEEERRRREQQRRDDEAREATARALEGLSFGEPPEPPRDTTTAGEALAGLGVTPPPPPPPRAGPHDEAPPVAPPRLPPQLAEAQTRPQPAAPPPPQAADPYVRLPDVPQGAPPVPAAPRTAAVPPAVAAYFERAGRKPQRPPPGRLDEGLPSEDEIRRAQATDVPREILARIGNALRAASGGQPRPYQREADQLRTRREQGLAQRRGEKRQVLEDERAQAQEAVEAEAAARAEERAQRSLDIQERRASAQEDLVAAQAGLAGLRGQALERDAALASELRDPASAESSRMRQAYVSAALERERLRPESVRRAPEEVAAEVEGLSGYEIQARMSRLGAVTYGARSTSAGAGRGGGGGAGVAASVEDVADLREQLRPTYGDVVDTMSARQLREEAVRAGRSATTAAARRPGGTGAVGGGEEILPGVHAGIPLSRGEATHFRRQFSSAASHYGALARMRSMARRFGAGAAIDPRAQAALASEIGEMRALFAAIQNTGVINPAEAPLIEATIPNPTSLRQMTFGELGERLQSFEQAMEREIVSGLGAMGVDDDGIDAALRQLRAGGRVGRRGGGASAPATSGAATPQGDTVRVRPATGGPVRTIPRTAWDAASEEDRAAWELVQ